MKKLILLAMLSAVFTQANAIDHSNKSVETVQSPDERPCTFFRLEGVTNSDPVRQDSGWFAVPIDHYGHDVIVSILLSAYAADKKINVRTSGELACGHPAARYLRYTY